MDALAWILMIAIVTVVVAGVWQAATKKRCPSCRSHVPRDATVCAACGRDIAP